MNRNHLRGALIALFPIMVSIVTGFILSATRSAGTIGNHASPVNCMIAATALLILAAGLRHCGRPEPSPAGRSTTRRELRRPGRPR